MAYGNLNRSGPPVWMLVIAAALLVFGCYFLWNGLRTYMQTTISDIAQATRVSGGTVTAAVEAALPTRDVRFTPAPSRTPIPTCQDFIVTAPEAIIRECASTNCAITDVRHEGDIVCVLQRDYVNDEWYIIDLDDSEFFIDAAYMHQSIIRAVNPTPTPSDTMTPMPTRTPAPTNSPLPTPPPPTAPTESATPSITPTFTPSPTPPLITG